MSKEGREGGIDGGRERERESVREKERERGRESMCLCLCQYRPVSRICKLAH